MNGEQIKATVSPESVDEKNMGAVDVPVLDAVAERKLMRKIDWRLLPILGALYSISLIDRTNISNARVAGMDKDLQLRVGNRYNITLLVFFIPYMIFEVSIQII